MLPEVLMFNKWLRRNRPHTTTPRDYTSDLTLFFAWADKPPSDVTLRDIDAYIEHCQQDLGHAVATINRRLTAIHTFYDFLDVETDDAPPNPVIPKRHYIPRGRHLPRDVEDADLDRLFEAVAAAPSAIRDRAMFLLMLRCGLRVGEVHNLSQGDLYLGPTSASLPRLWLHGKNGSQRVVYLSSQALDALQAWLDERPQVEDDAVFLNHRGHRITTRGIQYCLEQHCRRAGVSISCHQFRHTLGRHLVEHGMPITSVQQLLGHERLRTTQIYVHISNARVQADYETAIAAIEAQLSPQGGAS